MDPKVVIEEANEALRRGASGYVTKGVAPEERGGNEPAAEVVDHRRLGPGGVRRTTYTGRSWRTHRSGFDDWRRYS